MTDKVGFRIDSVEFNDVNGGSFSITVSKAHGDFSVESDVQTILDNEFQARLDTLEPFVAFETRCRKTRDDLVSFIKTANSQGKLVLGLGASTKGNVLLQYCGLTEKDISFVGEVNVEKYGCFTPGTWIPIISEDELLAKKPDYLIVLPWHFRNFFVSQKKYSNISLVFPLPTLEVINIDV
jgi:hypothetical protein